MPFIELDDINVHYKKHECSRRDADTFILVHGVGLNMQLWEPIIPFLLESYYVVTYEMRGHGETNEGVKEVSWETFINDLHLLIQSLKLKSVHLMGHGLGGTVVLKYNKAYPEFVSSLILISIPVVYPKQTVDAIIAARKVLTESGPLLTFANEMVKTITLQTAESKIYKMIIEAYCSINVPMYFRIFDLYLSLTHQEDFSKVTSPIMALAGDHDPMYITTFTLSAEVLKSTKFLIVPNSSNMVFIDQPKLTAEWIHDFLSKNGKEKSERIDLNKEISQDLFAAISQIYSEGSKKVEASNSLRVDFLSAFRVHINGAEKLDGWNQRYSKSLILYLCLHPTTTREHLCDVFFPDVPIKKALNNLKVYLNNLKKMLEQEEGHSLLLLDREHVVLQCKIESDMILFFESLRTAIQEDDAMIKLRKAKEILLSLPASLAPGIFDDWFRIYRDSIELQIVELATWAAIRSKEQNQLKEAVVFMKIALRFQPESQELLDIAYEIIKSTKRGKQRFINSYINELSDLIKTQD